MIQNLRTSVQGLWRRLSWGQRFTIVGLSAAAAPPPPVHLPGGRAPTYQVLFSNLPSTDASAIQTQLESAKIPYQLANGGTTILVPQAMVDGERLKLAGQGLPQGGVVGFSLFDKQSLFQGDSFTEQINYTRALEGELTRTIGQVSGVEYDRVNIVIPQQQLFSSQQASSTASVLLKFSPGATLTADQITGIQHLVASAVQGMKPDDVTVVDGSGSILSGNTTGASAGVTGLTALQAETRYASNLQAQLTAMLDTVVGPDRAVVRVNDSMDWTQRDATSTTYASQTNKSPLSESRAISSTSTGPGNGVGGVAGIGSNVPTYGTKTGSTAGYTQTQGNVDNTYLPSSTVAHTVEAPGTIKQLSIAVLLNGVRNKGELATLRQSVAASVGLNPARGDQLSISSVPFDTSAVTAAASAARAQQQQQFIESLVRWASLIIVPLILLFLLRRLLIGKRLREADVSDPEILEERQQTVLLPASEAVPALEAPRPSVMRQSMAELAREKPEVVAGLIGRWIEEDRG